MLASRMEGREGGRLALRWRQSICGLLMLAAGLFALPAAQAQGGEYRLSSVLDAAFPWGRAAERWAQLVRERSQGRIKMRIYPGASLVGGDQTRELPALQQGVIDLAVGSTINWSPQVRELNLFSLPFLLNDHRALDTLTQGEIGRLLFQRLEQYGVVPLAWGENGFRELSNSRRPITQPADLAGLRLRVVASPLFADIFQTLGARPVQMSWSDAQPALAAGLVDGQENPLAVYLGAGMGALGQRYLTLWHYVADPLIFAVNRRVWQLWSEQDRQLVRQAALEAARENIEQARQEVVRFEEALGARGELAGTQVVRLSAVQRQAFVTATQPVRERWRREIGGDLVERAEKALSACCR